MEASFGDKTFRVRGTISIGKKLSGQIELGDLDEKIVRIRYMSFMGVVAL